VVIFARGVLKTEYFRAVVVPADVGVWSFLHRRLHLSANGLLIVYRTYFLYGFSRMTAWFLYARFNVKTPFQPNWGGPRYLPGNDLSGASVPEMLVRTLTGGLLFVLFLWVCWITFGQRLWDRGYDPVVTHRGSGLRAVFH
jgi:hypothetical protein